MDCETLLFPINVLYLLWPLRWESRRAVCSGSSDGDKRLRLIRVAASQRFSPRAHRLTQTKLGFAFI